MIVLFKCWEIVSGTIFRNLTYENFLELLWWKINSVVFFFQYFTQMPEEETFSVFVKLMEDYGMRELYKPNMSELGLCIYQLENLVQVCE